MRTRGANDDDAVVDTILTQMRTHATTALDARTGTDDDEDDDDVAHEMRHTRPFTKYITSGTMYTISGGGGLMTWLLATRASACARLFGYGTRFLAR